MLGRTLRGEGAHSTISVMGTQLARTVAHPSRKVHVARARTLQMRQGEDAGEDAKEESRLLWSRRLNRAMLALRQNPADWGEEDSRSQDRVLWSRRLGRAAKAVLTDPDEVSLSSLWPADAVRKERSPMMSSAGMLELCELEPVAKAEASGVTGTPLPVRSAQDSCVRPKLPKLAEDDLEALYRGERVQRQVRDGRVGTGMVVVDVNADVPTVFAVLTEIDRYPERIPTVRAALTYHRGEKLLKTQFQISKFRLQINTELRCAREANMLEFKMDPERPAPFLTDASGFWFIEDVTAEAKTGGGRHGECPRTRIWLVADIACTSLLPTAIVDYAAARALPRATTWLKPVMESMVLPDIPAKTVVGADEVSVGFK